MPAASLQGLGARRTRQETGADAARPSVDYPNRTSCLPKFVPSIRRMKASGMRLDTVENVFPRPEPTFPGESGKPREGFVAAVPPVEDEEAVDAGAG